MTARIVVDGHPLEADAGDSVLLAIARNGSLPSGCLCFTGDCANCLAVVDGEPHVRMCLTPALPGTVVEPFPAGDPPPLPDGTAIREVEHRHEHVDVVVVGGGRSGRDEAERLRAGGSTVVLLDPAEGSEALAVYAGPEAVARVGDTIVRYQATEVVVATGSSEIQPVAPGNTKAGLLTPGAASLLAAAGVDLGTVVAVGGAPDGVACTVVEGDVVRFEGDDRVTAVVVRNEGGETTHPCDTVTVAMGRYPRNILARMAEPGEARTVGAAAGPEILPSCPEAGILCPCSDVEVSDLDFVWDRGFRELELIKRATLAGTGTCQGTVCTPHLRAFVADRGGMVQPTFTARPLGRQMTMAEAAAGARLRLVHRTSLDRVHRALGARMDAVGGWYRPWRYPEPEGEYWSVREGVSLGDVGTLGKMVVTGPDAVDFLEHLYPCRVADIGAGRSRYALLLAESGGIMDDGLISRVDDTTFHLTFTSGGASMAEAWVRDWANGLAADVRIMDRTHSLGAINVTGPLAPELMSRVGLTDGMRFMRHGRHTLAGVDCHVYRLSFTGEASFELHHRLRDSERLWDALMAAGRDLGVRPHGIDTLQTLRLEKGHIIVGMDTEPDSTPGRVGMEWAVKMDKPDFVGRPALERIAALPTRRRLVGLSMEGEAPIDGTPVHQSGSITGYVTSAVRSPVLGRTVMLAWVRTVDGEPPDTVLVGDRPATLTPPPFYDPEGTRARA